MSIQYIVEGNIKTDFKGDIKMYSKGNISYNSGKEITQTGKEKGISYGKADKLHSNDRPISGIDVTLNLFFDGTGNNKTNTQARQINHKDYQAQSNKDDDSYENDYSNVARGYDAVDPNAKNQVSAYIEGIGTVDLGEDVTVYAKGLGLGDTGIVGKVTKGCLKAAETIKRQFSEKKIEKLKVNVIGFSRGAAASRHFFHIATTSTPVVIGKSNTLKVSPPHNIPDSKLEIEVKDRSTQLEFIKQYGYFGACLLKNKLNIKRIIFNFVGLYDTVASYGSNHSNDTEELHLNSVEKARFVLQIASDDEFRENFRLTNINSCNTKGLEFTLPGVHSDIGGSYRNGKDEKNPNFRYESLLLFKSKYKKESEKFREMMISEGWYLPEQIRIIGDSIYSVMGKRMLSNRYDRISLITMVHYSKQFGVVYKKDKLSKMNDLENDFLKRVYSQLLRYMNACHDKRSAYIDKKVKGNYIQDIKKIRYQDYVNLKDLKILRNQYLHWSVRYKDFVHGENTNVSLPVTQRKRTIQNG